MKFNPVACKTISFFLVLTALNLPSFAETSQQTAATFHFVTSTLDSGPGSLRQAIQDAEQHTAPDTIGFHIPLSDPGYDAVRGVWTIEPLDYYSIHQNDLVIDGRTQAQYIGTDTNPLGPEIAIDGNRGSFISCIMIDGDRNQVLNLAVMNGGKSQIFIGQNDNKILGCYIGVDATGLHRGTRGDRGIRIQQGVHNQIGGETEECRNIISGLGEFGIELYDSAAENKIINNYIGINAAGSDTLCNRFGGVVLTTGARKNQIGPGNVITGNSTGIVLQTAGVDSNMVCGNKIGTDPSGTKAWGNQSGIDIRGESSFNIIGGSTAAERNIISGNERGISIRDTGTRGNIITGNYIGTDISGLLPCANKEDGILITQGATDNVIGPDNVIAFNESMGIELIMAITLRNTITRNRIHDNLNIGIQLVGGANSDMPAPTLTNVNPLTGTAQPYAIVEIFSGQIDQAMYYEGTATADASGQFIWLSKVTGTHITATATDADGNTSSFSNPLETSVDDEDKALPGRCTLHTNYPNPFNPATTIAYDLPHVSHVRITIFDITGQKLRVFDEGEKMPGHHQLRWDGRNEVGQMAASGLYFYSLDVRQAPGGKETYHAVRKMMMVK